MCREGRNAFEMAEPKCTLHCEPRAAASLYFRNFCFLVVCCHHILRSCASRFALSQVNCAQVVAILFMAHNFAILPDIVQPTHNATHTHKTQNTQHAGRKTQHRTAPHRVRCCSNRVLTRMASVQMACAGDHATLKTSTQDEDSASDKQGAGR